MPNRYIRLQFKYYTRLTRSRLATLLPFSQNQSSRLTLGFMRWPATAAVVVVVAGTAAVEEVVEEAVEVEFDFRLIYSSKV
jgi:hypothetical protein